MGSWVARCCAPNRVTDHGVGRLKLQYDSPQFVERERPYVEVDQLQCCHDDGDQGKRGHGCSFGG